MMAGGLRRRGLAFAALLAALSLSASRVRAEPGPAEVEAIVQRGIELRKARRNAEALAEFEKAYALAPTPRIDAQIALALHALGDWLGAERGLDKALAATEDPWIAQYRGTLEGALATVRAHLARLFVSVNVPAGELLINGVSVRTVPFVDSVRVVAGTLDVAVRAPGYVAVQRTLDVAPGTERRESFTLEPEAAPATATPPALAPAPASSAAVTAPLPSPGALPPPGSGKRSTLGYLSLGAAGLLGAGGVVAWRVREDNVAVYNDDSRCLVGTRTRGEQCGAYASKANEALGLEGVAFGLAAAATGVGVWLLLDGRPRARVAWCSPSGTLGVACGGRF